MRSTPGEMFAGHPLLTSRDVDEARHALTDLFLPVDFPSARGRDSFDMQLNGLELGRVTCGYMRFEDAVRIETAEAENFHIDIPTSGRATMRAGLGSPIYGTPVTAGMFMPGRPVEITCEERFAQVSLMITRSELEHELAGLLDGELRRALEFDDDIDLTTPGAQAMLHALEMIDAASRAGGGVLSHPLAVQRLEQTLMHSVLFAQPHNHSAALLAPAPAPGRRPVGEALEILRSSPEHPWTVAELAAAVSVSVRSLQEGFRRSLNTTPTAYLRDLRLEKVREELRAAPPGSIGVTEAAARWGFTHLGRFAAAYRARFSELPSETLRSPVAAARERTGLG